MSATINRIVALSGPMPDTAAHKRYLGTLSPRQLEERLAALEGGTAPRPEPVEFWPRQKTRAREEATCLP